MLNIGQHCAKTLGVEHKIKYIHSELDRFAAAKKYTVIFSFAAHMTEDRQHQPELLAYLRQIGSWLVPGGIIVFETHGYDAATNAVGDAMAGVQDEMAIVRRERIFGGQRELYVLRRNEEGGKDRCDSDQSRAVVG